MTGPLPPVAPGATLTPQSFPPQGYPPQVMQPPVAPVQPGTQYCATCGTHRAHPEQYCAGCGAPPAGQYAAGGPPGGAAPRRRSRHTGLIVAAVAIVLAGGGAGTWLALSSSKSSPSSNGANAHSSAPLSVAAQAVSIEAPVRQAQQHLLADISAMKLTPGSLSGVTSDARAYTDATTVAHAKAAALSGTSTQDAAVVNALQQLVNAQKDLAAAMTNLPTSTDALTAAAMTPAQQQADAVSTSSDALNAVAAGAAPPRIDSSTWRSFDRAVAARDQQSALRVFVVKLENQLSQSADGRSQLASALSQMQNNCALAPDQAATQFRNVAANRQSLLDQASALTVPPDPAAQRVLDTFQQAMRHSIAADNDYAAWMDNLYSYYYQYPVGCPNGTPTDSHYDDATTESGYATQAKTELVNSFDPLARRFGLRSDWTQGQV